MTYYHLDPQDVIFSHIGQCRMYPCGMPLFVRISSVAVYLENSLYMIPTNVNMLESNTKENHSPTVLKSIHSSFTFA